MRDQGDDPRPARGAVREVHRTGELAYSPEPDGLADPGEIVWAWVPYEEDPARGKDRPLVVVGRAGANLLSLMLSSKPHDGEADWLELGSGGWDVDGRASWVRLDRVFELADDDIRREGATLEADRFARVGGALRDGYGWR